MLTFTDIFKSSFLSQTGGVTADPVLMIIAIGLIVLFAFLIRVVYKKSYRGVMYSRSFGSALSITVLVTGFIIMTISSNIILSLGMVGALSIVRFRTAVKDALDITYMFWAVGLGIAAGAGLFLISILLFIVVAVFLLVTTKEILFNQPYLLVVSCVNESSEQEVMSVLEKSVKKIRLRSKTVSENRIEISLEVGLNKKGQTAFVSNISSLTGVKTASLLSCEGDISL